MKNSAKKVNEENYQPHFVSQAFKVIMGQAEKSSDHAEDPPSSLLNGLEFEIDLMTLVQLPASRLKQTVRFYVEVLELTLSYPERPIESNTFVQTLPKMGPSLHIIESTDSEFRHLHGMVNGNLEAYLAFYAKSLVHLHERLLQAGAEIVMEPSDGFMSFFDPEGHLIGAYERADSEIYDRFESNITGFRHVQMYVADLVRTATFFERTLGCERVISDEDAIYMAVKGSDENQPMIRLIHTGDQPNLQPMHWILDGRPKHALELHSKNIGVLKERVLENGGVVKEDLEFTSCGGYLKFYTPDGHYIWVNQDRRYCGY
ncbi:VOC family protein [Paenibacillus terrigena]|uniref:VOC family protein n=1 Tax=Paenibacillus terrigena TaxID=369333 RepID=UPI0028D15248|nr:VOC family protein [Paenibacillus terrigena]